MVLIIFSGISFVVSINNLAIKGFILEDLKKEVNNLKVENENIGLQAAQLKSYDNVAAKAEELKMVKVDKIDYIKINEETVAKK